MGEASARLQSGRTGNRVIAVGLRGHGTSDTTCGPFSTAQLLQDLQAALAALQVPERITLVGHSFGTALAAEFAAAHPERVEALILVAASGEYRLAWNLRYSLRLPTRLLDAIYPLFRASLKAPQKVLKAMHAESVSKWNCWSLYRDLQVPTLVIRGHGDRGEAHNCAVTTPQAALGAERLASALKILLQGEARSVADIETFTSAAQVAVAKPAHKSLELIDRIEGTLGKNALGNAQRHSGVIGVLATLQVEGTPGNHVRERLKASGRPEFDWRPQGISDSQRASNRCNDHLYLAYFLPHQPTIIRNKAIKIAATRAQSLPAQAKPAQKAPGRRIYSSEFN